MFARRRPELFLGVAFPRGLADGRLVRSSPPGDGETPQRGAPTAGHSEGST